MLGSAMPFRHHCDTDPSDPVYQPQDTKNAARFEVGSFRTVPFVRQPSEGPPPMHDARPVPTRSPYSRRSNSSLRIRKSRDSVLESSERGKNTPPGGQSITTRRIIRAHHRRRLVAACAPAIAVAGWWAIGLHPTEGHIIIPRSLRVGAAPHHAGGGWIAEAFLNVPNFDSSHFRSLQTCLGGPATAMETNCDLGDVDRDADVDLHDFANFQNAFNNVFARRFLAAERFVQDREPDFTFRTEWIDFPAGPEDSDLDANFQTVGDFLNDYVFDVSDPAKLDEPFGSLFLRFTGFVKVTLSDETRVRDSIDLPVWIDFGTMGFDAYRTFIGATVYQAPNVRWTGQPFFNFGPSVSVLGLFPVEITYLNIYDPGNLMGNERAGVEVYSWHGGGKPWPAGNQMVHPERGPATLVPPRVIYQEEDIRPVVSGDFEADFDIDLRDFQWLQLCMFTDAFILPPGCDSHDFDGNKEIDLSDYQAFQQVLRGPGIPSTDQNQP